MRFLVVLALVSCKAHVENAGFDATPPDSPDASIDAPAPLGPWTTPTPITITPVADDDPTATADLLELYFNRSGDIWVVTRATIGAAWGTPVVVPELSALEVDTTPELSYDGLTIYLASGRPVSLGANDIWMATRASRTALWNAPVHVPELSSIEAEGSTASSDGLVMVLDSQRATPGTADIFVSTRPSMVAPWRTPVAIAELNAPTFTDGNAMLSADALTIYFDSNRTGDGELYVATRGEPTKQFGAPSVITELSSTSLDGDPWISPDGHTMYFTSSRDGTQRLWQSTR